MLSCVGCHSQYPHLHCPESGTPSKVKSSVGLGKKSRLMKTVQTMKGHSNYQNCPGLRSHAPHSNYGTYVTLAPKVLVFPVFVQVSSLLEPSTSVPGIKPLWEKMPFHVLRNMRLPLREQGSPALRGLLQSASSGSLSSGISQTHQCSCLLRPKLGVAQFCVACV